MSFASSSVPKAIIPKLVDLPRDIFNSQEAIAPLAGATTTINTSTTDGGIGLDLTIINNAAALGPASCLIDKSKLVTLAAGARFNISNVLWMQLEIRRGAAGAVNVDVYYAGVSYDLLKAINPNFKMS